MPPAHTAIPLSLPSACLSFHPDTPYLSFSVDPLQGNFSTNPSNFFMVESFPSSFNAFPQDCDLITTKSALDSRGGQAYMSTQVHLRGGAGPPFHSWQPRPRGHLMVVKGHRGKVSVAADGSVLYAGYLQTRGCSDFSLPRVSEGEAAKTIRHRHQPCRAGPLHRALAEPVAPEARAPPVPLMLENFHMVPTETEITGATETMGELSDSLWTLF